MPTSLSLGRVKQLVASFKKCRILVVGDLMLDRFIWGRVNRISPEAPVPVVEVTHESVYPGGAANVARNLREFCGGVVVLGSVAKDRAGGELRELLESCGIETTGLLTDMTATTTLKTRVIARNQQVVRYDREKRQPPSRETSEEAFRILDELVGSVDAIITEDYDKGFLTQVLADEIVCLARSHNCPVCVDPNPKSHVHWRGATCMKPNRSEAYAAAGIPQREPFPDPLEDPELREVGRRLLALWETQQLLITLGEHGMAFFDTDGALTHSPAAARTIFDVSGAGDTAIAVYTLAVACGASGPEAMHLANAASGVAVAKLGTATVSPAELIAQFDPQP